MMWKSSRAGKRERGYALLFVMFLVAMVVIGSSVAVLNELTEGRRQKEAYMIWCGQQYERAIGLYYRKYGKFPTSLDDLVKVENGVRFLREKYPDPMSTQDGAWRLIYVTPAGVLVGSVNYKTLQQMAFVDKMREMGIMAGRKGTSSPDAAGNLGAGASAATALSGALGAAMGPTNANAGFGGPQNPLLSQLQSQLGQAPGGPQSGVGNGGPQPVPTPPSSGLPEDLESSGPVFGGFIIGVGGTSSKASLKVYKGGGTYKQWEFIYNPLEQVQTFGGVSNLPGATPAGQQPNKPSPFSLFPQPPPPQKQLPPSLPH